MFLLSLVFRGLHLGLPRHGSQLENYRLRPSRSYFPRIFTEEFDYPSMYRSIYSEVYNNNNRNNNNNVIYIIYIYNSLTVIFDWLTSHHVFVSLAKGRKKVWDVR
jgi:hypothetical protein